MTFDDNGVPHIKPGEHPPYRCTGCKEVYQVEPSAELSYCPACKKRKLHGVEKPYPHVIDYPGAFD